MAHSSYRARILEGKGWVKRARGGRLLLQSQLDELSWRLIHKGHPSGIMGAFLRTLIAFTCRLYEHALNTL